MREPGYVGGEGAIPARVMLVGDRPGLDEARVGRPFVGRAGRELDAYLRYPLPQRHQCYLTNVGKIAGPTVEDLVITDADTEELEDEIARVRPDVIVTLGTRATAHLLGEFHALETIHGIGRRMPDGYVVWPTINPAAALRAPALHNTLAYDFWRLGQWLHLNPDAQRALEWQGDAFPDGTCAMTRHHPEGDGLLGVDTEGYLWAPWGMSWAGIPGRGFVHTHDGADLAAWVRWVQTTTPRLVFHNALYDLPMFERLGADLGGCAYDDTMIMAYLLGVEPLGLKALAYRHAGMVQGSYEELTSAADEAHARAWLETLTGELRLTLAEAGLDPQVGAHRKQDGRAQACYLLERLLDKPDPPPSGYRHAWVQGRAREILTKETGHLDEYAGDADMPPVSLDAVDPTQVVEYAARDADATLRIAAPLRRAITVAGLDDVYQTDLAILPMVARMSEVGMGIDAEYYTRLDAEFAEMYQARRDALDQYIPNGTGINPHSGDQISAFLYGALKLDQDPRMRNLRIRRTKGGRGSTADPILEALKPLHPAVELIQECRELQKLRSTYITVIRRAAARGDGRLHATFRVTSTDTGRLSAANPNVLAFPKHSAWGQAIRGGIVAAPGRVLLEVDLSQIEMCVFAHDSKDANLIAEIQSGVDLHARTASRIFNRPVDDILREKAEKVGPGGDQRFAAKAVNFGTLMGITAIGLHAQFQKNGQAHTTVEWCEQLLRDWGEAYPGGRAYIERKHAEARRHGFVRDMWGRIRWVAAIRSADDRIRAEAERQAQATPIQSGAQGIIKRAMGQLWPALCGLRQSGVWVEVLCQIHDALFLEVEENAADLVEGLVHDTMTHAVTLRVPVKAAASRGRTWGEV